LSKCFDHFLYYKLNFNCLAIGEMIQVSEYIGLKLLRGGVATAHTKCLPEIIPRQKAVVLGLFNSDVDRSSVLYVRCQISDADGFVGR